MFRTALHRSQPLAAWLLAGLGLFAATPADSPRNAGVPPMAGRPPGTQQENDWVDSRWSQTDVGPFLASNLRVPNGSIAKGLSLRLGTDARAAVVYDTATATLRCGWSGGFLQFDPARFGLIQPPRIEGTVEFVAAPQPAWGEQQVQWRALRRHGHRLLLEYQVGDRTVRETPTAESVDGRTVFTRTLEIGPGDRELRLTLLRGDEARLRPGSKTSAELRQEERTVDVGFTHDSDASLQVAENRVEIVFPPANVAQRHRVFLGSRPSGGAAVQPRLSPEDLQTLAQPGPAQWLPPLETRGERGRDTGSFTVDTLTLPYDNPWKALLFLSGVGFTRDGTGYVCSIHGDVWRVTGIDDSLRRLTWHRFATGLFQPLGLQVVGDRVHVLGRDQITVLHDENGDGEADRYENFHNAIRTSTGGHDYVTSLEVDETGNLYYVDPIGAHRVSADGRSATTLATGFRNPNGLGVGPGGIVTVAPQQGTWTPSSALIEIQPGGYYGFPGPRVTADRPLGFDPPLCWIPHSVDNSGSSQVWVPAGRWGPLGGRMLHFSWGRCQALLALRSVEAGVPQGAILPLPVRFISGPMRGVFRESDGQLYVAGSTGWQTASARDGCFQRVRYTGRVPVLPVAWRAHANGLAFTFSVPLSRETAEDPGSFGLQQWNYRYAEQYGSKDWSVKNPDREGRDTLEIRSARLDGDGRTVFLEVNGLGPVMQWELKYNLDGTQGEAITGVLHGSIHRLGPPR